MKKQLIIAVLVSIMLIPAISYARRGRSPKVAPSTPRQFTSSVALPGVGGASVTIVATAADEERAKSSMSSALSDAATKASQYTSEARSINEQPAKTPVEISARLATVLGRCKDYAALTKGGFDITGTGGWKKIKVKSKEGRTTAMRRRDDVTIDPSLFALALKGFLADDIITSLTTNGWANVQVVIGNVTRNIGRNIHTPWTVRIDAPTAAERGKFAFRAYNYSVGDVATAQVTPAIYPATNPEGGEPAVINTVVFANEASVAAAYAIAAYVNGVKDASKGMGFIRSRPEIRGIVIALDGTMLSSEELAINRPQPQTVSDIPAEQ